MLKQSRLYWKSVHVPFSSAFEEMPSQSLTNWVMSPFCIPQGYRAEMDNPAMLILMPPVLRNRKDVLFGNMPEIYDFHNKYDAGFIPVCIRLISYDDSVPKVYLAHRCILPLLPSSCRIFLHSLESCLGAPERVGFCFLDRVGDSFSHIKQAGRPMFLLVCRTLRHLSYASWAGCLWSTTPTARLGVWVHGQQQMGRAAVVTTLWSAVIPSSGVF